MTISIPESFGRRKAMWERILSSDVHEDIQRAANRMIAAFERGRKALIFGNGGSAAEAQHFAAELVGRFEAERRALPAIALTTDSSILTAQSNDYDFTSVFSRQIQALARTGDIVVGMTTSDAHEGHSANIREAFRAAKKEGAYRIGFFSTKTRHLLRFVDLAVCVPETNTALIQEAHLAIIHIISKAVEESL